MNEVPQRAVELPAYQIDKYPVTNRRYAAFVKATGRSAPFNWPGGTPPTRLLDHPVVFVNREDARAYAAWCGKRLLATVSKPALFLFQNMEYSCIHSATSFGRLEPGRSATGVNRIYMVKASLDDW